jgi:hypothetical protein
LISLDQAGLLLGTAFLASVTDETALEVHYPRRSTRRDSLFTMLIGPFSEVVEVNCDLTLLGALPPSILPRLAHLVRQTYRKQATLIPAVD